METLEERVRFPFIHEARKHALADEPEEYATEKVDEMTNSELLLAISEALNDMRRGGEL